jgi:hypothetical protein
MKETAEQILNRISKDRLKRFVNNEFPFNYLENKKREQVTLMKYELKKGNVLKDGHTMFIEDVVKDLNYLNNKKMKGGEKYGR